VGEPATAKERPLRLDAAGHTREAAAISPSHNEVPVFPADSIGLPNLAVRVDADNHEHIRIKSMD
jgi:hypothetical protein